MKFVASFPFFYFLFFAAYGQTKTAEPPQKREPITCAQARLIEDRLSAFVRDSVFAASLNALAQKAKSDGLHEHIISFGKDSTGSIIASAISTGTKSSSLVPTVANAFADLHTHPRNTPPSSGDVYGLLKKNKGDNLYDSRFVATPDGALYALVVSDATAAAAFLENFPAQQAPGYSPLFPDALLNEYRDAIHLYGAKEELAMAYILNKYSAGVVLLKQEAAGSFLLLRATVQETGEGLKISASFCRND